MIATQYTNINMVPSGYPPVVYMSQYDVGRPIGFVVSASGSTPDFDNYTVTLEGTRSDGTPVTAPVTTDGNICALETTATMTNKTDRYPANIVVTDGNGDRIASIPVTMMVVKAAMDENAEGVEEDRSLYQQYTGTVQSLIADIRTQLNAETAARQAAVSAEASARQAADNTLQSNINAEASTRATQDASLQSQIDQIIAPSGEAPSAAEVQNARVGADGVTYSTLGDAIRTQVSDIKSEISNIRTVTNLSAELLEKGGWSNGSKNTYRQANRARTKIKLYALTDICITRASNNQAAIYTEFYTFDGAFLRSVSWSVAVRIPKNTVFSITFTTTNSGTPAETSVADIVSNFVFFSANRTIVNTTNEDLTAVKGLITSSGDLIDASYQTRITITEYFKTQDKLMHCVCDDGYMFYIVGYASDFSEKTYGVNGTWQRGEMYYDMTDYAYVRFMLSKTDSSNIVVEDMSHLSVDYIRNVDVASNVVSISKDGINTGNKGYAPKYPQSSVVSFAKAYDQGFRTLMLHVQFTSDNVPVVYHDQTINAYARNSDGTEISGTVSIASSTLATLDTYDFGIAFGSQYAGTKITRLVDALRFCKDNGMGVVIEPTVTLTQEREAIVCDMIKAYGLDRRCGYQSYYISTLTRIKALLPKCALLLWADDEAYITANAQSFATLKSDQNRIFIYTYHTTSITDATIASMYGAGIELMLQALTGTEPANIRTGMTALPYANAVVSQVVPADLVLKI